MKPLKALGAVGAASAALLTGCAAHGTASDQPASEPMVGMANPASVWCVKHYHGMLEIKKDKDGGEYAICHLPDGRSIEEWELFRADHPQK
jgi:putative hemolysin